jgi:hypothetical protein
LSLACPLAENLSRLDGANGAEQKAKHGAKYLCADLPNLVRAAGCNAHKTIVGSHIGIGKCHYKTPMITPIAKAQTMTKIAS